MKFVHQVSRLLHHPLLFLFSVNPHIANQLGQHGLDDWNGLRRLHVFHKIPFTSVFNAVPGQKLSVMVVFDLERLLLQNGDDFTDRKLFLVFFENLFEGFLLGDSFESNQVVEVFGDVGNFLETHSLDPLLPAR